MSSVEDIEAIYVPPGQFVTRSGCRCAECEEFIPKAEYAGYNEDDEIVCDTCFVPYEDR